MTTAAHRNSRFAAGSGAYSCRCCGRNTRATGRGDNENVRLCAECYDLAGLDNIMQDADELSIEEQAQYKALVAEIRAKGGTPRPMFPEFA